MTVNPAYIQSLLAPLGSANLALARVDRDWQPANEAFYADLAPVVVGPPVALSGVSYTYDDTTLFGLIFDDVQIIAVGDDLTTGALGYLVLYIDTGNEATSRIVAWDQLDQSIAHGSQDAAAGVTYSPYGGGFFQVYGVDPSALPGDDPVVVGDDPVVVV